MSVAKFSHMNDAMQKHALSLSSEVQIAAVTNHTCFHSLRLTLVLLNELSCIPTSNYQPIRLLDSGF